MVHFNEEEIVIIECPKCDSEDFDILEQNIDIRNYHASYDCICNKCSKLFLVIVDMIIKEIK